MSNNDNGYQNNGYQNDGYQNGGYQNNGYQDPGNGAWNHNQGYPPYSGNVPPQGPYGDWQNMPGQPGYGAPAPRKSKKGLIIALVAVAVLAAAAAVLLIWHPWSANTSGGGGPAATPTPEPVHVHEWIEATCDEPRTCKTCGETEGEALGHDWGAWQVTKEAGCTTEGTEQRVCAHDSSHVETRSISAIGHDWGSWSVATQPSCTRTGTEKRVCRHDSSHVETRDIAALGHDFAEATYSVPATCRRCGATTGDIKGYLGTLDGYFGDPINLHGYTQYYSFELYEPVENCMAISVQIDIDDVTGNPFGGWYLFGRDLDGKWQNIGQFEVLRDNIGKTMVYSVTLKGMPSFTALTISPIYDNKWSVGYFHAEYVEVQAYIG